MQTRTNPIAEIVAMLPKLAFIAMLTGATAAAASQFVAAPQSVMLVGGQFEKPSGVGFVLAVSLQRNGAGLR